MSNLNSEWAALIVEELVRSGIDTFVGSPGSRSTPLVAAIARHKHARLLMHTDERGAAFFAVGYARAKGRPAPFLCTSGSAVANALPAVVEAYQDHVPMLLLTADRPPELIDTGANQSILQSGIFGSHVLHSVNFPTPHREMPAEAVLTAVGQALYRTADGPVHINCPFRKPLEPTPLDPSYLATVSEWIESDAPYTSYHAPVSRPDLDALKELSEKIKGAKRPLLILGRLRLPRGALDALIQTLQWPTFPDILSGYRLGTPSSPLVHDFSDRLDEWEPDLILHLGGTPLSLKLQEAVRRWQVPTVHVEAHPQRVDSTHRVTQRFHCNIERFAEDLLWLLDKPRAIAVEPLQRTSSHHFCEALSRDLEEGQGLWLASSSSIRLMAKHSAIDGPWVHVGSNRGASGIDGTIASAAGFAYGLRRPVTCLLGDLAFLHDVSSLPLINKVPYPVRLVVLDDNGGGIFDQLPVAKESDLFERYFRTPHNLSIKKIAEGYGVPVEIIQMSKERA